MLWSFRGEQGEPVVVSRSRLFVTHCFAPWAISRAALVLIGWLAIQLLSQTAPEGAWEIGPSGNKTNFTGSISRVDYPFVNMWSRWDASWYHSIAKNGYQFAAGQRSNVAFFPVYPLLVRATHAIVHSQKDLWWFVCGIIVSNAALLGALLYLFLLARFEFDEATARRAVLYLLVFPTTLFLSAVYSESVFLFCIIGAFYHARRGQWWWAGALGGMAALSRPPGIMIFVGLVVEYLLQCEFNWRKVRLNVFALGLPPLCLAGYFGYLRYAEGTATAALQAQGAWGLGMQNPLRTVASFFYQFRGGARNGGGPGIHPGFCRAGYRDVVSAPMELLHLLAGVFGLHHDVGLVAFDAALRPGHVSRDYFSRGARTERDLPPSLRPDFRRARRAAHGDLRRLGLGGLEAIVNSRV